MTNSNKNKSLKKRAKDKYFRERKMYDWLIFLSSLYLVLLIASIYIITLILKSQQNGSLTTFNAEVLKSILNLMSVVIIGTLLGAGIQAALRSRENAKSKKDIRIAFLNELESAYQSIEDSRRELSAAGFRKSRTERYAKESLEIYIRELNRLASAQASLRRLHSQLETFNEDLFTNSGKLKVHLTAMKDSFNGLFNEYEQKTEKFREDPTKCFPADFEKIYDFTERASYFKEIFENQYTDTVSILRKELIFDEVSQNNGKQEDGGKTPLTDNSEGMEIPKPSLAGSSIDENAIANTDNKDGSETSR